ncbi:translation initiation factor eIF3 core subunit b [Ascoidea rubescens DSM 1968]|uniref:Eukaryotic translation initiation factor 3 subunit B n=1 Tax=Ascoidea rubescens DSM 1968 TaxID=1344418 RepID=A0A1D2VQ99_9ASCO|nr:translation initiation factor eIF3 subunit [Ascoidea rubescens DSM 1968]ODV63735.1 translation initiation factor eIF3 subunit [Ascoidea rubescens DSM 1968]
MAVNDEIDISLLDLDDIDYSDLEEKYKVEQNSYADNYVVIDGIPIAPKTKFPVLQKVLTKLFTSIGCKLHENSSFHIPADEKGRSKGWCFVQFENPSVAEIAIKRLNGKKLDAKHRLFLNKLSDIDRYGNTELTSTFKEPKIPPFQESEYIRSWLKDKAGRDQFLLHRDDTVGVFWNNKLNNSSPVVPPRSNWTSTFVKFSPLGSFLFSIHPQGVQSWGRSEFDKIGRFFHPNVRLIDISPNEKYLVTLSPDPITLPPEDHANRANFPFLPKDEGNQLVIWDILTELPKKTFALPTALQSSKKLPWPLIKWSHDDKYCARAGPGAIAVYDSETMELLGKQIIKVPDIVDFEWAPTGVPLEINKKTKELSNILAYWTPELENQPARVAIMEIPTKKVLRAVNVFSVSDCKIHWQSEGKYLCCKVDRHTKSRKTLFTNFKFFQLTGKDIPVENLDVEDLVTNFAWEPKGERFVTISTPGQADDNPLPKNTVSFYAPEVEKVKINASLLNKRKGGIAPPVAQFKKYQAVKSLSKKRSNTIFWSPAGRFVLVATILPSKPEIEFFDFDYVENKGLTDNENKSNKVVQANVKQIGFAEHFGLVDLAWDPSGRFVAGWSSIWRHPVENGYKLYDFSGHLLKAELIDNFKDFQWRPRPASLLTANNKRKVRKQLREYSAQFDEIDAMEASEATRELILKRRGLLEEWRSWRENAHEKLARLGVKPVEEPIEEEIIEEIKEEIIEETEEIIE